MNEETMHKLVEAVLGEAVAAYLNTYVGHDDRRHTMGTCYEGSALLLTDFLNEDAGWLLVHGRPRLTRPPFVRYGHAWLERDLLVLDVAARVVMLKADYYRIGNIEPEERFTYTFAEALRMIVDHGHWGPWEGLEALDITCSGEEMMGFESESTQ